MERVSASMLQSFEAVDEQPGYSIPKILESRSHTNSMLNFKKTLLINSELDEQIIASGIIKTAWKQYMMRQRFHHFINTLERLKFARMRPFLNSWMLLTDIRSFNRERCFSDVIKSSFNINRNMLRVKNVSYDTFYLIGLFHIPNELSEARIFKIVKMAYESSVSRVFDHWRLYTRRSKHKRTIKNFDRRANVQFSFLYKSFHMWNKLTRLKNARSDSSHNFMEWKAFLDKKNRKERRLANATEMYRTNVCKRALVAFKDRLASKSHKNTAMQIADASRNKLVMQAAYYAWIKYISDQKIKLKVKRTVITSWLSVLYSKKHPKIQLEVFHNRVNYRRKYYGLSAFIKNRKISHVCTAVALDKINKCPAKALWFVYTLRNDVAHYSLCFAFISWKRIIRGRRFWSRFVFQDLKSSEYDFLKLKALNAFRMQKTVLRGQSFLSTNFRGKSHKIFNDINEQTDDRSNFFLLLTAETETSISNDVKTSVTSASQRELFMKAWLTTKPTLTLFRRVAYLASHKRKQYLISVPIQNAILSRYLSSLEKLASLGLCSDENFECVQRMKEENEKHILKKRTLVHHRDKLILLLHDTHSTALEYGSVTHGFTTHEGPALDKNIRTVLSFTQLISDSFDLPMKLDTIEPCPNSEMFAMVDGCKTPIRSFSLDIRRVHKIIRIDNSKCEGVIDNPKLTSLFGGAERTHNRREQLKTEIQQASYQKSAFIPVMRARTGFSYKLGSVFHLQQKTKLLAEPLSDIKKLYGEKECEEDIGEPSKSSYLSSRSSFFGNNSIAGLLLSRGFLNFKAAIEGGCSSSLNEPIAESDSLSRLIEPVAETDDSIDEAKSFATIDSSFSGRQSVRSQDTSTAPETLDAFISLNFSQYKFDIEPEQDPTTFKELNNDETMGATFDLIFGKGGHDDRSQITCKFIQDKRNRAGPLHGMDYSQDFRSITEIANNYRKSRRGQARETTGSYYDANFGDSNSNTKNKFADSNTLECFTVEYSSRRFLKQRGDSEQASCKSSAKKLSDAYEADEEQLTNISEETSKVNEGEYYSDDNHEEYDVNNSSKSSASSYENSRREAECRKSKGDKLHKVDEQYNSHHEYGDEGSHKYPNASVNSDIRSNFVEGNGHETKDLPGNNAKESHFSQEPRRSEKYKLSRKDDVKEMVEVHNDQTSIKEKMKSYDNIDSMQDSELEGQCSSRNGRVKKLCRVRRKSKSHVKSQSSRSKTLSGLNKPQNGSNIQQEADKVSDHVEDHGPDSVSDNKSSEEQKNNAKIMEEEESEDAIKDGPKSVQHETNTSNAALYAVNKVVFHILEKERSGDESNNNAILVETDANKVIPEISVNSNQRNCRTVPEVVGERLSNKRTITKYKPITKVDRIIIPNNREISRANAKILSECIHMSTLQYNNGKAILKPPKVIPNKLPPMPTSQPTTIFSIDNEKAGFNDEAQVVSFGGGDKRSISGTNTSFMKVRIANTKPLRPINPLVSGSDSSTGLHVSTPILSEVQPSEVEETLVNVIDHLSTLLDDNFINFSKQAKRLRFNGICYRTEAGIFDSIRIIVGDNKKNYTSIENCIIDSLQTVLSQTMKRKRSVANASSAILKIMNLLPSFIPVLHNAVDIVLNRFYIRKAKASVIQAEQREIRKESYYAEVQFMNSDNFGALLAPIKRYSGDTTPLVSSTRNEWDRAISEFDMQELLKVAKSIISKEELDEVAPPDKN